jgi:acyl carrier protein
MTNNYEEEVKNMVAEIIEIPAEEITPDAPEYTNLKTDCRIYKTFKKRLA